jgi:hypothetical protein
MQIARNSLSELRAICLMSGRTAVSGPISGHSVQRAQRRLKVLASARAGDTRGRATASHFSTQRTFVPLHLTPTRCEPLAKFFLITVCAECRIRGAQYVKFWSLKDGSLIKKVGPLGKEHRKGKFSVFRLAFDKDGVLAATNSNDIDGPLLHIVRRK